MPRYLHWEYTHHHVRITLSKTVPDQIPTVTSTPIASRQDQPCNSAAASNIIYSILSKIDQLDSGIKSIKKDILQPMECRLNGLNISVVSLIKNLVTYRTYTDVCRSRHSVQEAEQLNRSQSGTSYVNEGYGDQSGTSINKRSLKHLMFQILWTTSKGQGLNI